MNITKRSYLWNTIGVFAQNAISPLLLVVVTRVNGIDDSGLFSFAFSVAIIFWTISMWGGRTYQVSDIKRKYSSQSYIMVRLLLGILVFVGAVLFCLVNSYDIVKTSLILALVLLKVVESVADSLYGVLQVHERLYTVGKSLLYKFISSLVVFVVVDYFTGNVIWSSLGMVVVHCLWVIFYDVRFMRVLEDIPIQKNVRQHINKAVEIIKTCWPIFIVAFLAAFSLNIPRYFIDIYHSSEIGYFGILAMPVTLVVLVMTFILQPNIVQLSRLFKQNDIEGFNEVIRRIVGVTLVVGVGVFIGTYFIGVHILHIVFGVDFSGYKDPLLIMIIGALANALVAIFINILIIMRHFKEQFYILLITNCLLVIASFLLIKTHGLTSGVILFTLTNSIQVGLIYGAYASIAGSYAKKG